MSALDQTKDSLLRQIGATLLLLQELERLMTDTLKHASNRSLSVAQLNQLDRRTMGALAATLRQRVELSDTFAADLAAFISDRNIFIHSLSAQPWFDWRSVSGQLALIEFLRSLHRRGEEAIKIFLGYLVSASDENGTKPEHYTEPGKRAFVSELHQDYLHELKPRAS